MKNYSHLLYLFICGLFFFIMDRQVCRRCFSRPVLCRQFLGYSMSTCIGWTFSGRTSSSLLHLEKDNWQKMSTLYFFFFACSPSPTYTGRILTGWQYCSPLLYSNVSRATGTLKKINEHVFQFLNLKKCLETVHKDHQWLLLLLLFWLEMWVITPLVASPRLFSSVFNFCHSMWTEKNWKLEVKIL